MKHLKALLYFLIFITALGVSVLLFHGQSFAPGSTKPSQKSSSNSTTSTSAPAFDKTKYSLTDPASLWVVVNKQRPLPGTYEPSDLVTPSIPLRINSQSEMQVRKITASALGEMFAAAKTDGLSLMLASGYRSYAYQQGLYNSYVQRDGQASADQYSARAGHSEHQTGLAVDIEPASKKCEVETCFETTPEGKWLFAHASEYGFILRYHKDAQAITGYNYEPWHYRYVGKDASKAIAASGKTVEEFLAYRPLQDISV